MVELTLHRLRWTTKHGSSMGEEGIARRNGLHSTNCGPGDRESHRVDSEWNKATRILGDHVLLNPPSGCTECAEVITCCTSGEGCSTSRLCVAHHPISDRRNGERPFGNVLLQ